MRLMSFAITTEQVKNRTKDVTRRTGWLFLKPGDRIRAVEKAMGLKKGDKPKTLAVIEIVSVRREPLEFITDDEVRREGFPDMTAEQFVRMFCEKMKCAPHTVCTRIEFRYL